MADRFRKVRNCFAFGDDSDGDPCMVIDQTELSRLLSEFAECDWDAGKDALLECLEGDLPTPKNPHTLVKA